MHKVAEFAGLIYAVFIRPITILFEVLFSITYQAVPVPLFALTVMSLVVNLLVLPLYNRADELQEASRKKEEKLRPMAEHIKKVFSGDEKVMILQTYYNQMGYSPLETLKSSVSLLLQIPFFIAAYTMISSLIVLKGSSAGPIKDLSLPDSMLHIGSFSVNVLPILMTAINILSCLVFVKGKSLKEKLQLFITAGVFLVLLYNSPSGLVYYWTCNNIFSLVKNIVVSFMKKKEKPAPVKDPLQNRIFIVNALVLSIFVGVSIPADYLVRATVDLLRIDNFINPAGYLWYSAAIAFGLFFVWCGVFYALSSHKKVMNCVMVTITLCSIFNYFAMYTNYGDMTRFLTFIRGVDMPEAKEVLISIAVTFAMGALVVLLQKNSPKLLLAITAVLIPAFAVFSGINIVNINDKCNTYSYIKDYDVDPTIKLSSSGKNVVVIMLDRAQGCFFPYIINENEAIRDSFDGFTYYPDCISFGQHTNLGIPALLGGYEYTPASMNARADMSLKDKHNEALLLMPALFDGLGYDVTVIDPPYANYMEISDLSIYDQYPGVEAYYTYTAMNPYSDQMVSSWDNMMKRDLFFYGAFFTLPSYLRPTIYDGGYYNDLNERYSERYIQDTQGCSVARGANSEYLDSYYLMDNLSDFTVVDGQSEGSFLYIDNLSTHSPMLLDEPDYSVSFSVDNTEYDRAHVDRFEVDGTVLPYDDITTLTLYEVNVGAYIDLAQWFDYLRACGVYDNTRIIIVADHGGLMYLGPDSLSDNGLITSGYNPILLVKDFDAHGFTVSDEFMTNAETPYLAVSGLIEDPVNPFTGNPITSIRDMDGDIICAGSSQHTVSTNNGNTFLPGDWYRLTDPEEPLDVDSWEYMGCW